MTVLELIKQLEELPLNADVRVLCACHYDDVLEHNVVSTGEYFNLRIKAKVVRLYVD